MNNSSKQEATLLVMGPLQTQALAQWDRQKVYNLGELIRGDDVAAIVIPAKMRDGAFWSFRHLPDGKKEEVWPYYDYRYADTYCSACGDQYRFPVVHLVRSLGDNQWQSLRTCPYGHLKVTTIDDSAIKSLLGGRFRLMENGAKQK